MTSDQSPAHYLLGHTDHELHRLDLQGEIYRTVTERAFQEKLNHGDAVLDIGCGSGDVSLKAAEIVGVTGSVLGIDRGEAAIDTAREKFERLAIEHAHFEQHELDDFFRPDAFDAVVGRFILMHQRDPARTLRSILRSVRPGGQIVMMESWMNVLRAGGHSEPLSPLYAEIVEWKSMIVEGAGADLAAGGRLRSVLEGAGAIDVQTRVEALVAGGATSPYYEYIEQSVRSMLPESERLGISGFTSARCEGLGEQLRDEVVSSGGTLIAWPVVVGTGRVPVR